MTVKTFLGFGDNFIRILSLINHPFLTPTRKHRLLINTADSSNPGDHDYMHVTP